MLGTAHAGEGDRARTAGQGRQPGPAHADFVGQYPGRTAGDGRRPHPRRPHPVVPAVAGAQRPGADRDHERGPCPRRVRRLPAPAGGQGRTGGRDPRPHHRRAGRPPAHPDLPSRFFCARTGCALVAVDYRLAPEHKFPAAIDDAVAAFRWLAAEAIAFGIDAARIVIAGDSAGGTIAAVAARLLRDEARPPCLQWLIYPATDLAMRSPSYKSCGEGFLLTHAGMTWFRGHYLNDLSETDDPRASPLHANDLSGLPPALIYTAGFDPLRDEGQAYAERLSAAGVKTIHREFDSLIHGFAGMRGALQAAARAMDDMVAGLRHELAGLGR